MLLFLLIDFCLSLQLIYFERMIKSKCLSLFLFLFNLIVSEITSKNKHEIVVSFSLNSVHEKNAIGYFENGKIKKRPFFGVNLEFFLKRFGFELELKMFSVNLGKLFFFVRNKNVLFNNLE